MISFSRKSYSNLVEHLKTLSHDELLEYVELVAEHQKEAEQAYRKALQDSDELISLRNIQKENDSLKAIDKHKRNYALGGWIEEQFKKDRNLESIKIMRDQVNIND